MKLFQTLFKGTEADTFSKSLLDLLLKNPLRNIESLALNLEYTIYLVTVLICVKVISDLIKYQSLDTSSNLRMNIASGSIFSIPDSLLMYLYILAIAFKVFLELIGVTTCYIIDEEMSFSIFPTNKIQLIICLLQPFIIVFLFIRVYRVRYQPIFNDYYNQSKTINQPLLLYVIFAGWVYPSNELSEFFWIFISHSSIFNMQMALITLDMATKAIFMLVLSIVFYFDIFSYLVALEDGLVKMMRSQVLAQDTDSDEDTTALELDWQPIVPPIGTYRDLDILLPTYEDLYNSNYPNIPPLTGTFGHPPPPYSPVSNVQ